MTDLLEIAYARPALLVVFGLIGLACLPNAIDRHGSGAALLAFGSYLCLTWMALHANR